MILGNTIWLDHPDYPGYKFSPEGNVLSLKYKKPRLLKFGHQNSGYLQVNIANKQGVFSSRLVHRLISEIFINKKNKNASAVNHKDGNKKNNNISNLEWCTYSENMLHAVNVLKRDYTTVAEAGRKRVGEKHHRTKIKDGDVAEMFNMKARGYTLKDIGERYGMHGGSVGSIIRRKRWPHIKIDKKILDKINNKE